VGIVSASTQVANVDPPRVVGIPGHAPKVALIADHRSSNGYHAGAVSMHFADPETLAKWLEQACDHLGTLLDQRRLPGCEGSDMPDAVQAVGP
jgi:hypothetical protein